MKGMNAIKRTILALCCLLLLLTALYPIGYTLCYKIGYNFELISIQAFSIVITLISVSLVVLSFAGGTLSNEVVKVLMGLLLPISFVNVLLYVAMCTEPLVAICGVVNICCSAFLTLKYGYPKALKIIVTVLSVLLSVPVMIAFFIGMVFKGFSHETVINEIDSPNRQSYIQVVDHSQGALGGDTLVKVYEKKGINAIIFRTYKIKR